MKINLLILIVVLAGIALYTWRDDSPLKNPAPLEEAAKTEDTNIQTAPDFSFQDMHGKTHRLSDYQDKAIVLNFWASWCAPCVVEFPQMLTLAEKNRDKAVFVFLSSDDKPDDIARFLKKHGRSLPAGNVVIGWDKNQEITQTLYQTFKLPETYLLSPGLKIRRKVIGLEFPWDQAAGQEALDRL